MTDAEKPHPPSPSQVRWAVGVLAALLAIHLAWGLTGDDFIVSHDGAEYVRMADWIRAGHGLTYDGAQPVVGKPPGMPAFLAAYTAVVGSLAGFHVVQLLLLFAAFLAVRQFLETLGYRRWGLAAVACLTLVDPLRNLAAGPLSEPLFLALFAWGMAVAVRAVKSGQYGPALWSGLLLCGATYVRPLTLGLPLALALVTLMVARQRWRVAILVAAVHLLGLAPWIIRTSRIMGEPTPLVANWGPMFVMTSDELHRMWSTEGWVPVFTHPSYATLIGKEFSFNPIPQRNLQAATLAGWQSDPSGCFNRCLTTNLLAWSYVPGTKGWRQDAPWLFRFGQLAMLGYYLFVLAGAIRLWRENRLVTSILVTQAIVCAAVTFPVPAESRYLIPAYLLLLPLAMVGLQATVARWRR